MLAHFIADTKNILARHERSEQFKHTFDPLLNFLCLREYEGHQRLFRKKFPLLAKVIAEQRANGSTESNYSLTTSVTNTIGSINTTILSNQAHELQAAFQTYNPVHMPNKEIKLIIQSLRAAQGQSSKDLVAVAYRQYRQNYGELDQVTFRDKLIKDLLFLTRQQNSKARRRIGAEETM